MGGRAVEVVQAGHQDGMGRGRTMFFSALQTMLIGWQERSVRE
jgi:hypothetical protein